MKITFSELIFKFKNSKEAFELVFSISKKVKCLNDYYENRDVKIDFSEKKFDFFLKKIINEKIPIARLTKKTIFDGNQIIVFKKVFIPRWETEEIVKITTSLIQELNNKNNLKYIDICSGTGSIGISVFLKNKNKIKQVSFVDISGIAVKNIKKNLIINLIKCETIKADWFKVLNNNNFEVITANFPYICKNDQYDQLIIKYEPKKALFGKESGWEHYKKLINFLIINDYWRIVVLECSEFHELLWEEEIKKNKNWKIKKYRDLNNKFRFISICKN